MIESGFSTHELALRPIQPKRGGMGTSLKEGLSKEDDWHAEREPQA
jgi:hypothetical protein